jgi:hypothetical protein
MQCWHLVNSSPPCAGQVQKTIPLFSHLMALGHGPVKVSLPPSLSLCSSCECRGSVAQVWTAPLSTTKLDMSQSSCTSAPSLVTISTKTPLHCGQTIVVPPQIVDVFSFIVDQPTYVFLEQFHAPTENLDCQVSWTKFLFRTET